MIYKTLSTLACALVLGCGGAARADIISFDTPGVVAIDAANQASYSEAGFRFSGDAASFLLLDGIGSGGSGGLAVLANAGITLMAAGGGLFSLAALDQALLDPGNGAGPTPPTLLIQGLLADNRMLSQSLVPDALLTGINFNDWTGLQSVRFSGDADFILDNLQLQAVPEPGSAALALLGLLGLAGALRGRRRGRPSSGDIVH